MSLYGMIAEFGEAEALLEAVRQARAAGYRDLRAYTPYPVEGLSELLGIQDRTLHWFVLLGGVAGAALAFFMQYYSAVIAFPFDVGGRPLNSWPAFLPITVEVALLVAGLVAVLTMLLRNGLPLFYHPVFNVPGFELASRNRFFLCIRATDPRFDPDSSRAFLRGLGAREVEEVRW